MYKYIALLLFFSTLKAFALDYGIDAKREGDIPLQRIQIFSERCSGSYYLQGLLLKNFHFINPKKEKKVSQQYVRRLSEKCTGSFNIIHALLPRSEKSKITPQKVQFFYERSSGNYAILYFLLRHLPHIQSKDQKFIDSPFGHKHFPPWFELPLEEYLGPKPLYTFENSDDTLFIVIFRNPYDWLRSFYQKPWHAAKSLLNLSFSQFIRTPWELDSEDRVVISERKSNPLLDYDPLNKNPFESVLQLRTAKIRNMLMIKTQVKNIYYVNYETLRDHPKQVLQEIAHVFDLPLSSFTDVKLYKGSKSEGNYTPKKYPPISPQDLEYINAHLDQGIEEKIHYQLSPISRL